MNPWVIFLCIFGIIFILILIFGLPRKRSERKPSIEGLYSAEVAKATTSLCPYI